MKFPTALALIVLLCMFLSAPVVCARRMRATWYENGRVTATGAPFNPNDPTIAASRTLPFGTVLIVRNRKKDKSIYMVVQDRGPENRRVSLDLSRAAAKLLGYLRQGVAELDVTIVH